MNYHINNLQPAVGIGHLGQVSIDLLLASYTGSDRVQAPVPVESIHALAGCGAFATGVFSSAVEAHFLPCGGTGTEGLLVLQQRAHCEHGMDELAAQEISRAAMSLGASGIVVVGGTDASLRGDDALDSSKETASRKALLLVSPSGALESGVAPMPAWTGAKVQASLKSHGIDMRGLLEAHAQSSKDAGIRAAAREAGQVRAGDTPAVELGVAGLADSKAWEAAEEGTASGSGKGGASAGGGGGGGAAFAAHLAASTAVVGKLFYGVDLAGQAHRIVRQATALQAQEAGAVGASARGWLGACSLLQYAFEGRNLDDAAALAERTILVAACMLSKDGDEGKEDEKEAAGAVEGPKAGLEGEESLGAAALRACFADGKALTVPAALRGSADPAALSDEDARKISLL